MLKRLAGFGAFIVAFLIAKALVTFNTAPTPEKLQERVAADMMRMDAAASKNHPAEDKSEALRLQAISESTTKVNGLKSLEEKRQTAADTFWGFYFINASTRKDYCLNRGIDISAFVKAFQSAHSKELLRAQNLYEQRKISPDSLVSALRPTLEKTVAQDMRDMAKSMGTDEAGACKVLATNARAIVTEWNFRTANPVVAAALLN